MRTFAGDGGLLYATGEPFAFFGTPLDDCGDGWAWRSADPTLRCWTEAHLFEAFEDGRWVVEETERVDLDTTEVHFSRCLSGLHVRASGTGLTTTLVGTGHRWTLRQPVMQERTLTGSEIILGRAVAHLDGVTADALALLPPQRALAVLPVFPAGAYVGFGEPSSDKDGVNITFDDRGVTYATTAESPQETLATAPIPTEDEMKAAKKAAEKVEPTSNGFVTRDAWLAQAGRFAEKEIEVDGLGKLLIMELSGAARAAIQTQQSRSLLLEQGKSMDKLAYDRAVLLAGVADPSSPEGARRPLFTAGDMDRVLQIGGGKIAKVVEEIEKLSGLDVSAPARAEENSDGTPSAAGTS